MTRNHWKRKVKENFKCKGLNSVLYPISYINIPTEAISRPRHSSRSETERESATFPINPTTSPTLHQILLRVSRLIYYHSLVPREAKPNTFFQTKHPRFIVNHVRRIRDSVGVINAIWRELDALPLPSAHCLRTPDLSTECGILQSPRKNWTGRACYPVSAGGGDAAATVLNR